MAILMEVIYLKIRTTYSAVERGAVRESASNGMGFGQTHGLHIIFSKINNRYSFANPDKTFQRNSDKTFYENAEWAVRFPASHGRQGKLAHGQKMQTHAPAKCTSLTSIYIDSLYYPNLKTDLGALQIIFRLTFYTLNFNLIMED